MRQTTGDQSGASIKGIAMWIIIGIAVIAFLAMASNLFETVRKGTYQVKQAAISGKMTAKMTPGIWLQLFGDIQAWDKANTFYFTADSDEGKNVDQSMEVRFNDGSVCDISGTMRVFMPTNEQKAIELITVHGYKDFDDLELKLLIPVVRNSLRLTANLMTARESYAAKRPDFVFWAWDQIQNGLYKTTEETREVLDLVSGEKVTKSFKIIKKDSLNNPIYEKNPLAGMDIKLSNFEIKTFVYSKKVKEQIATQQEAFMNVATAKAKAAEAEQNALTKEAEGKANVMTAKYQKEEEKIRAVVDAQKDKEVAELAAQKELEVAKLQKLAAKEQKAREILLGQGESARKKLVMQADGALKQKLDTYERVMANAWKNIGSYKGKWVPEIVMGQPGGSTGGNNSAQAFMDLMMVKTAKDLNLDMKMKK